MANGEIHRQYLKKGWIVILPFGIIISSIFYYLDVEYFYLYLPFIYLNYFFCNVIDPDLDLISITGSEGIILRNSRKFYLGFLGALFVSYSFIYSYVAGIFGGHRSNFSHGWVIGTIGRMIFFNIPLFLALTYFNNYAVTNWGIENGWTKSIWFNLYMGVWFFPYVLTQFISWNVGDGIHLILDTEWAKGVLYKPKKSNRE